MSGRPCRFLLGLVWSLNAFGQLPSITPGGVVNAASGSTPLVPGRTHRHFRIRPCDESAVGEPAAARYFGRNVCND
jgi:hypothetical protein